MPLQVPSSDDLDDLKSLEELLTSLRKIKRRKRSAEANSKQTEQLNALYNTIIGLLEKSNLYDIEEISDVLERVLTAKKEIATVAAYRLFNPGWDVTAKSFSNLTSQDLFSLNVELQAAIHQDSFSKALSGFKCNPSMPDFDYSRLLGVTRLIGQHREAGCRMVINEFIYTLIRHCKRRETAQDGRLVYVIPELPLSRSEGNAFPVIIEHESVTESGVNRMATLLSGSTDYGLLSLPDDRHLVAFGGEDTTLSPSLSSLSEILNVASTKKLFQMLDGEFMLVEAKGNPPDLAACVPQVIGQALASSAATYPEPKDIYEVMQIPFCLTNGSQWIFGLVDTSGPKSICWQTDAIDMSSNNVSYIMEPFFVWATQSKSKIRDMFQGIAARSPAR
ncbi:hypothetical protein HWV62_15381 [Athelia sp. TMB]|nr:hypothetical protein HWV62_15381 [Athelia sp. TMB]